MYNLNVFLISYLPNALFIGWSYLWASFIWYKLFQSGLVHSDFLNIELFSFVLMILKANNQKMPDSYLFPKWPPGVNFIIKWHSLDCSIKRKHVLFFTWLYNEWRVKNHHLNKLCIHLLYPISYPLLKYRDKKIASFLGCDFLPTWDGFCCCFLF